MRFSGLDFEDRPPPSMPRARLSMLPSSGVWLLSKIVSGVNIVMARDGCFDDVQRRWMRNSSTGSDTWALRDERESWGLGVVMRTLILAWTSSGAHLNLIKTMVR